VRKLSHNKAPRNELIKFREKILKKTQEEVAKILGITRFTYCRYENGTRNPKPTFIEHFAKAFNLNLEQSYRLFYGSNVTETSRKATSTGTEGKGGENQ